MSTRWIEAAPNLYERHVSRQVYIQVGPHGVMPRWHSIALFVRGERVDLGQTWWSHTAMAKRVATERAKSFLSMAAAAYEVLR